MIINYSTMLRAMHNSVRWITEEQNSLLYTMRGPWNWDAVNEMLIIGDELMDSVDHPVSVILDIHDVGNMLGPGFLVHSRRIFSSVRPNCSGRLILMQPDSMLRSVHTLLERAFSPIFSQIYIQYAETLDHALLLLDMAGDSHTSVS